ncbi:hypothetical protein [Tateyamaria pelophila]|uniref:hypothetical protein n=1 Tax=Tateyamaria pelophila TaxID=328415 RepID=UPI001CBFA649|nr:hypothetical protein [Tateyamaria pelophila]
MFQCLGRLFVGICLLFCATACTELRSLPIYTESQITGTELARFTGVYRSEPDQYGSRASVVISPMELGQQTLTALYGSFQSGGDSGRAVFYLSRIPGTADHYLATLPGKGFEKRGKGGVLEPVIPSDKNTAFVLRADGDQLTLWSTYSQELLNITRSASDAAREDALVRDYVARNLATITSNDSATVTRTPAAEVRETEVVGHRAGYAVSYECQPPFTGWLHSNKAAVAIVSDMTVAELNKNAAATQTQYLDCIKTGNSLVAMSGFGRNSSGLAATLFGPSGRYIERKWFPYK